jgi:hypothetical protein
MAISGCDTLRLTSYNAKYHKMLCYGLDQGEDMLTYNHGPKWSSTLSVL